MPIALELTLQESLDNNLFLKARMTFLILQTLESISGLGLGPVLNSKITTREHKNVKTVSINRPQKGHLSTMGEDRQSPGSTPAGDKFMQQLRFFPTLHMSTSDHKSTASTGFGVTNELANTESVNKEDPPKTMLSICM